MDSGDKTQKIAPLNQTHILFVDDDILASYGTGLKKTGFTVFTATGSPRR